MATQSTDSGTSRSVDQAALVDDFLGLASSLNFLVAALDDLRWDVSPNVVLLAAALGGRGRAGNRHRGA